ncbi:MAG: TonB-dependent receptor [Opitutaceae bacterium]
MNLRESFLRASVRIAAAVSALSPATISFSQTPPAESGEETVELAEVVVEGRGENFIGRALSGSEGAVARLELDMRPFLRTGEIVEHVPGMIVTQHSGTGKANQYFLRGFNLDHGTDFSVDLEGMPLNMRSHGHGQGYLDLNPIMPELVRRLDYSKGVHDVTAGDFSAAGRASIRLYDELPSGFLSAGAGEDNFWRIAAGESFHGANGGVFTAALEAQSYDGPWVRPEDLKKLNGVFRFVKDAAGGRFSLLATTYDASWDSTDQIPERLVESGELDRLGNVDPTVGGESSRHALQGGWTATDGSTQVSLYAARYDLTLYSNFTYFLDDPVNGDQFEQADERWIYGGRFLRQIEQTGNGREIQHRFGIETRMDDIPEVGLYRTQGQERLSTVREDDVRETSVGAFWDSNIVFAGAWRASFGIRGDYYFFDVDSDLAANSGSEDAGIVSPKVAVVYRAAESLEFYGNAGLGFHSNDARGTTISIDPATGEPADPVDALARSKGGELGVRWVKGNVFTTSVALWGLDLDSELIYVGDAGTTEAGRPSGRTGIEWSAHVRPLDWLTFDTDISLTRGRFDDDDPAGSRIPGSLSTVISAGATAELTRGLFGVLRLRHFGPRPLIEDNSVRSSGTSLVDARFGWGGEKIRVYVDVLNLFDSEDHDIDYFYASRLPSEPDAGIDDVHFHPVEPRTFRVYGEWKF